VWPRSVVIATAGVFVLALSGCKYFHHAPAHEPPPTGGVTVGNVVREPVLPAGYTKIAPGPASSSAQILAQTASVFRGTLKDVSLTYDDCGGPRIVYGFSGNSPLLGETVNPQVSVKILGGQTPRGTWLTVSEVPQLALDSEYVVFLRNTDWTYSPIVANLAFRVEKIGGQEVLVHPSGKVLTGWGEHGPTLSAQLVTEQVGSSTRGYRNPNTKPNTDVPTTQTQHAASEARPGDPRQPPPAAVPESGRGSALPGSPSLAELRDAGMFARPKLLVTELRGEQPLAVAAVPEALGGGDGQRQGGRKSDARSELEVLERYADGDQAIASRE
jgi:hypothetical protein